MENTWENFQQLGQLTLLAYSSINQLTWCPVCKRMSKKCMLLAIRKYRIRFALTC